MCIRDSSKACGYAEAVERLKNSTMPQFNDIDRSKAQALIERVITSHGEGPFWLSGTEISDLLACYGIKFAVMKTAGTAEEAAEAAKEIGFPVAVKLDSESISHKTDVGGVILDVRDEEGVVEAFNKIKENLRSIGKENEMEGVTVSPMVKEGLEIIVGTTRDALGSLIMFGMGGIYTEILKDTVFRLNPLTDTDAKEMTTSIKMSRLFSGYRDMPAYDIKSVQELLLRVSAMVTDIPEIAELDMNPAIVQPEGEGYRVVDCRILIDKNS